MELISIIVPVYNLEKEIGRCLGSILHQTYENIEIIVVNDGSTDNSGKILDEYKKEYPNIRVIHKENEGVTSARLCGVQEARGKWIGFVDGDDFIEPDMYEFLIKNAKNYNADISHCGYQMVFDDRRVSYFYNTGCLVLQDRKAGLADLLDGSRIEPGLWNKLFHKNLFHSLLHTECMPSDIKINEDLLMNYYLFSAADQSVYEDKCKYHYIVRENSASRQKLNEHKIMDPIKVKQMILDTCDQSIKSYAEKAYVITCIYVYCSLVLAGRNEFEKERKYIRSKIVNRKDWFKNLPRRTKILAIMIAKSPLIFQLLYPLYVEYWQKNKYE